MRVPLVAGLALLLQGFVGVGPALLLEGRVVGAMVWGRVFLVGCVLARRVMRGGGVVREGKVVIDEKGVMRRHHHTPKLAREEAGNRRRRRRREGWTGIFRKLEARLVVLEMLHDPGHDIVSELAGGQSAAQCWVDRLS